MQGLEHLLRPPKHRTSGLMAKLDATDILAGLKAAARTHRDQEANALKGVRDEHWAGVHRLTAFGGLL